MSDKQAVKVAILGEEYSVKSEATAEHTRAVAAHVDRTIRQVMEGGRVVDPKKAAILAALQITDELIRTRESGGDLVERMRGLSREIKPWLPPAKRRD